MAQRRKFLLGGLAATTALATGFGTRAQSFPTKPLRLVVPFAAGGNADVTARLAGEGMSR